MPQRRKAPTDDVGSTEMFDLLDGILDLAWNTSQSNKISALNNEVSRLKQSADSSVQPDSVRTQIDALRAENGELRLYIAVLFRVMKLKGIIGREELVSLIEQIDQEDGKTDQARVG